MTILKKIRNFLIALWRWPDRHPTAWHWIMFAIGLENLFGGLFDPSRPRYDIAIGGILVGMVISYFVHRTPHQQVTLRELFHRLRRTR